MTLKAESLYLEFIGLGPERTIPKLSEITGQKVDNLYKMCSRYKWIERAALDDKAIKEKYDNKDYSELEAHDILSGISRKSLEKLDRVISTVKVSTVRDAKTLLELSQLASGKPTEITQASVSTEPGPDIVETINRILPDEWADRLITALATEYAVWEQSQPTAYN